MKSFSPTHAMHFFEKKEKRETRKRHLHQRHSFLHNIPIYSQRFENTPLQMYIKYTTLKTAILQRTWQTLTLWISMGGLFCPSGGRSYAIFLWTGIFLQIHNGFSNWSIWQLLENFFFRILFKTSEIMTVKVEQLADSVSIDPARSTLNIFSCSKMLSFW